MYAAKAMPLSGLSASTSQWAKSSRVRRPEEASRLIGGNTAGTFFRETREREEWRAKFGVFVEGLWAAVRQIEAAEPEAGKVS